MREASRRLSGLDLTTTPTQLRSNQPQSRKHINAGLNSVSAPPSSKRSSIPDSELQCSVASQAINELIATRGAHKRQLGPQQRLFAQGDPASSYYVIVSGDLIVHTRRRGRPSIRFIGAGDLIMFDNDGLREAHCDTVSAASVIWLDPAVVGELARSNGRVANLIECQWAQEAKLIKTAEQSEALLDIALVKQPNISLD